MIKLVKNFKRIAAAFTAIALAAAFASCAADDDIPAALIESAPPVETTAAPDIKVPSGPAAINTFGVAWSASDSLCPMITSSRLNLELAWLLYEGLFELTEDGQAEAVLCESVTRDGNIWSFTVKEGVVFSDGEPLTASDVVYSLELAMATGSNYASRLACIASVRETGEYTLEITTKTEMGRLELLLNVPVIKADTGNLNAPVGSGLYVLATVDGESSLKTSPYRRGETSINSIELVDTPEAELLLSGFELGSICVVSSDPTATDALVYSGDYEAWDYATTNMCYLGFNTRSGVMADAELRRLFASAVDRETICRQDMEGYAEAVTVPFSPRSAIYEEAGLELLSRPIEEVAEELSELGWSDLDGDGWLEKASGRSESELAVRFVVCDENSYKAAVARRIAEEWRLIGINVELSELSWSDYLSALSSRSFDVYFGEIKLRADFDITSLVGSGGALNYGGYSSTETDELLAAYIAADEYTAADAAAALCEDLEENVPVSPVFFKCGLFLARRGELSNVEPIAGNIYNNVEIWRDSE